MACCALAASGTIDRTYRMHRIWRSCWTRNHRTYSHFVNRKRIVYLINQFWWQILPINKPCFPQSCLSEHMERVISYVIMYFRVYLNPSLISMCWKQHTFSTLINNHNLAMIWEDPRRIWIRWRYNGVVWSTNHNSIAAVTSPCCKPKNGVFLSDSSTQLNTWCWWKKYGIDVHKIYSDSFMHKVCIKATPSKCVRLYTETNLIGVTKLYSTLRKSCKLVTQFRFGNKRKCEIHNAFFPGYQLRKFKLLRTSDANMHR